MCVDVKITVEADGTVKYLDANGEPLPPDWIAKAKREHGGAIRLLILDCCDKINAKVEALGTIHVHTPAPHGGRLGEVSLTLRHDPISVTRT
jgi:hypothetical protein